MGSGQEVALKNKSLVTKRVTTGDVRPESRPCTSAAEVTVAFRPMVEEEDAGGSSGGGVAAGDGDDGDGGDGGGTRGFGPAACRCAKAKLTLEEKITRRDDNGDNKTKMTTMTSLVPEAERDGISSSRRAAVSSCLLQSLMFTLFCVALCKEVASKWFYAPDDRGMVLRCGKSPGFVTVEEK
ncbi:hypothetical protein VaNZ11_012980 [Volvox africanus]|uniref:Uncharacterized protein n=1 Tax=Volvox africanus TaxID=51714 RepID=A0ABQ5SGL9_9CHLO|nr:hypothetical protein VaNZ11_012980 [Volvox africanus]